MVKKKCGTLTKEFDGILKIPSAGSIFSSLAKQTSGRNHAQVTWTHRGSTSVGFIAPPEMGNYEIKNIEKLYKWEGSVQCPKQKK